MTKTALPPEFITQITDHLGPDAPAFIASYDQPATHGLRVNPEKISLDRLRALTGWNLEPIPWCRDGAYIDPSVRAGAHPYHAAGLYYLQEPSAMAVAELADLHPGQFVLDLAASPGGKSTQILSAIGPTGMLVANEIHPARIKALGENLERWGATNAIITNRSPEQLLDLGPVFDRVVVDAPCSGEGLFRRDPDARREWSVARVNGSADRQREILAAAIQLMAPGGKLTYSTCTFNQTENEQVVADLLATHPEWLLERTERYWPHEIRGEGHTIARLAKSAELPGAWTGYAPPRASDSQEWAAFASVAFADDPVIGWGGLVTEYKGRFVMQHDRPVDLYHGAAIRNGLWLGDSKPGRFEPSHALALAVDPVFATNRLNLTVEQARRWLTGEPMSAEGKPGWVLITVDGFGLGWGKRTGNTVKNHYPKGLRR